MSNQGGRNTNPGVKLSVTALEVAIVALSLVGWMSGRVEAFSSGPVHPSKFPAPALVAEETRQPGYDDFLRLIFVNIPPPGPPTVGGPDAYRVFFGATAYYEPPVTISQIAIFSGIPVHSDRTLIAMRCIPPKILPSRLADPALATWPNLITRIREDYETHPPTPGTADEAIEEIAESFDDSPSEILTQPLAYALGIGEKFFEPYPPLGITDMQMQNQMSMRFGTFTSFIGLGYAAEGTASSPSFDAAQTMDSLATPDFILKNVTLAQAGCHCIEVPPTVPNRDNLKLDPDFILKKGGNGSCVEANLWAQDDPY